MITKDDVENYGSELIDMTRRAAVEAVGPELAQLRAENAALRNATQRTQRVEIERALDAECRIGAQSTPILGSRNGCRCRRVKATVS
jgi:hypothetical protein